MSFAAVLALGGVPAARSDTGGKTYARLGLAGFGISEASAVRLSSVSVASGITAMGSVRFSATIATGSVTIAGSSVSNNSSNASLSLSLDLFHQGALVPSKASSISSCTFSIFGSRAPGKRR